MKRLFLVLVTIGAGAWAKTDGPCVDFSQRPTTPLHAPPPLSPGKVTEISGIQPMAERGRTLHWQGARGFLPMSVRDAMDWILDHTRWKDMDKTKLEVKTLSRPGYDAFHVVSQDTRVFAFVRIQWVEEWAYTVLEGTRNAPEHVLTTYQKSAGTDHIRRLCGSVEFRSRGTGTDAYFYQEAEADHYEVQHIQELHRRFFATLGAGTAADGGGVSR